MTGAPKTPAARPSSGGGPSAPAGGRPLISVVTATFNAAPVLPGLLESLAAQTFRDFELIVQDGGSTDDTLALAERYRPRLPGVEIESAPDDGIYDAWNKALARTRGRWVLFLGADDRLIDANAFQRLATPLADQAGTVRFVCTPVAQAAPDGTILKRLTTSADKAFERLRKKGRMPTANEGVFYRAALFETERFDPAFRICGDLDFMARSLTERDQIAYVDAAVSLATAGGVSDRPGDYLAMHKENLRIVRASLPGAFSIGRHLRPVVRGYAFQSLCGVLGEKRAGKITDGARALIGKKPKWSGGKKS